MRMIFPKISPGKGRFPKDPRRAENRRAKLRAGAAIKSAIQRENGLLRSRGAASECVELDPSSAEFAVLREPDSH
jgi:hypothetical protein